MDLWDPGVAERGRCNALSEYSVGRGLVSLGQPVCDQPLDILQLPDMGTHQERAGVQACGGHLEPLPDRSLPGSLCGPPVTQVLNPTSWSGSQDSSVWLWPSSGPATSSSPCKYLILWLPGRIPLGDTVACCPRSSPPALPSS